MSVLLHDEISNLIGRLKIRQSNWDIGDSLSLFDFGDVEIRRIGKVIDFGKNNFGRLSVHNKKRWGALLLLAGAAAFKSDREGNRNYETIENVLGIRGLAETMRRQDCRDEVENAARELLGIDIITIDCSYGSRRYFVETMVAHSGLDMVVLESCSERVAIEWSWAAVESSSIDDVESFIEKQKRKMSLDLTTGRRALLDSSEGLRAISHTLIELSKFRRDVLDRHLVKGSIKETREAIEQEGLDPTWLLGAKPSDNLLQFTLGVRERRGQETGNPGIVWLSYDNFRGLGLKLPKNVQIQHVGPAVDRVLVYATDSSGLSLRGSQEVSYVREGEVFRREGRTEFLPLPFEVMLPLQMLVRYRIGDDEHEILHSTHSLLGTPITMFHAESGNRVDGAHPGTRVVIACSPGWRFKDHPAIRRLVPAPYGSLEIWRAEVPSEPVSLAMLDADGEAAEWILSSAPSVRVNSQGAAIDGMRLSRAPVYLGWPELKVYGFKGRALMEVVGPRDEVDSTEVLCRSGRVAFKGKEAPGLYKITLTKGRSWKARCRFVVLPSNVSVVADCQMVRIKGVDATLTVSRGIAAQPRDSEVRFVEDVRGKQSIGVSISLPGLALLEGTLEVSVYPPGARVLDRPNGAEVPEPIDLSICDENSILEIEGQPESVVLLEADGDYGGQHWRIGADGRRAIELFRLPRKWFDAESKIVSLTWDHGSMDQKKIRMGDPRRRRPRIAELEDGTVHIDSKRVLKAPAAELLQMASPWEPPVALPATLVESAEGSVRYAVTIPEGIEGPLAVALLESGDRPVTGLAMITSHVGLPPTGTSPAEQLKGLLWDEPFWEKAEEKEKVFLLKEVGEGSLEGIARLVDRYDPKFFWISDVMPAAAGRSLLRRFIKEPGRAEDGNLGKVLLRMGYDIIVTSYSDFAEFEAEVEGLGDEEFVDLLDGLSGRRAGLLIPALFFWKSMIPRAASLGCENITPWADLISKGEVVNLSETESELIVIPPEDLLENGGHSSKGLNMRAWGLLQARLAQVKHSDVHQFRNLLRHHRDEEYDEVRSKTNRVPQAVLEVEAAVFDCAKQVDLWRSGQAAARICKKARNLSLYCPTLMDYWMNYFAFQSLRRDA